MRASNGDNSDCHLPFISDGLNFEQAINKVSVSESSDSLGNQANPVPSGLVATPEFITVSGSDSAFPFTQSNGLQSFQALSDVNDSLLGTVTTNDILPQNTLQSQVDSLLGGSNDVYMSTMENLDPNLQQSSSDFKNPPDTVVIINLRDYEKTSVSSLSSPGTPPIDSPSSPNNLIIDADTQASLIQRSENLNLETLESNSLTPNTSNANGLWGVLDESAVDELPCKAHKPDKNSDAPSSLRATHTSESETLDVDRITAMSAADFAFSKIESQTSGAQFTFGTQSFATSVTNTELKNAKVSTVTPVLKHTDVGQKAASNARSAQKKTKEPSLSSQFSSKSHGFELRILEQPEEQHRARYMTEGSRGAVKDQTQQGYPVVQLFGPVQTALLQVFVGTDTGKVKPHPFYQACKVSGKNSTPCSERDIDSTTTIEIELSSTNDLMASIDCVGILKLRNADVEQRIGVAKTKKRSTRARMVFRAIFNRPDGVQQILQVTSSPIVCTQPVGQPEVSRLSLTACSAKGGKDLFIIGKNFMKGTKVFFRETNEDDNKVIWEKEADIEKDYFQPTHLICVIPEYFNLEITKPVSVNLVVSCSGKLGDPRPFIYQPLKSHPKVETPMEVEPSQPQTLPFGQCPNTLELLRLLQQNHQSGFQVPSETLPPAFPLANTVVQSSSSFSDQESTSETKCAFSSSFHEQSHQSDSQFASQLESSSNFHSQTPVQTSPVQSPPQLHSTTQFQPSNPTQPSTDQGFQQTAQLQSSTDEYLSTTQMTPSNQLHSSTIEMHTNDDYQNASTQQHHQQQSPSSQLNSSLTDFHSMSEMTDNNSIKSSPMLTNNSSQFQAQTFSFNEAAAALLQSQQQQHQHQQQQQLHPSSQMNLSNAHIQFQASQQQSNPQMHLTGSDLHLNMTDSNQFHSSLKMPMTNSVSKLTSHQSHQNALQSLQCQSENQALRQTQFQLDSQTQASAQAQSTQFSQLMSSLPSASAPQIIIVGNPQPVSGRSNVFSLGGNSQQPAPSIFIIPSLSTLNENSVSQQDNDVLSLLESLLRGNNCNNNNNNNNSNNNLNRNNNNNEADDNQLQQQQQQP